MSSKPLLTFTVPQLSEILSSFLDRASHDEAARADYINDTAGVISQLLFPDSPPISQIEISKANRILLALLSNTSFLRWAGDYNEGLIKEAQAATKLENPATALQEYALIMNRARIQKDVFAAAAKYADPELIASLGWKDSAPTAGPVAPADVFIETEIAIFEYAVWVLYIFYARSPLPANVGILTRVDLASVASQLAASLEKHAIEVRESGLLTEVSDRPEGYVR